jgi:hypothetical protein
MTRLKTRFPLALVGIVGSLAAVPLGGSAMHAPTSTDEARAIAKLATVKGGQAPTPVELPRVTTSHEARLLAGAARPLPAVGSRLQAPGLPSTTDEAPAPRASDCGELVALASRRPFHSCSARVTRFPRFAAPSTGRTAPTEGDPARHRSPRGPRRTITAGPRSRRSSRA